MTKLLAGLLLILGGCAQLPYFGDKVNASLADVGVAQVGPLEQSYKMRIRLQNPTAKTLEIKGMSFDVEVNGRRFARGVNPQTLTLDAYSDALVDVIAVSDTPALLNQIIRLKGDKSKLFRYRLTGSLHMPKSPRQYLAFDHTGEVDFSALAPATESVEEVEEK